LNRAIEATVKKIRFAPNVAAEVRAIEQRAALGILRALHRYVETGKGRVKPLSGEFEGLLCLRVGNHRVLFDETEDTITVHRVADRRDATGEKSAWNSGAQALCSVRPLASQNCGVPFAGDASHDCGVEKKVGR